MSFSMIEQEEQAPGMMAMTSSWIMAMWMRCLRPGLCWMAAAWMALVGDFVWAIPTRAKAGSAQTQPWHLRIRRLHGDIRVSFQRKLAQPMRVSSGQRSPLAANDVQQRTLTLSEAQTMLESGVMHIVAPWGSHLQVRTLHGSVIVGPGAGSVDGYNLNGRLEIKGALQWVRARTVNGHVSVREVPSVQASSVSGALELSRIKQLLANTVSGTISIQDTKSQQIDARAVSGSIVIQTTRAQQIRLQTFSGSLALLGPFGALAQVSVRTMNGQVSCKGPLGSQSELFVRTNAGDVQLHWPKSGAYALSLQAWTRGTWKQPTPPPFQVRQATRTQISGLWTPPKASKQSPARIVVQSTSGDLSFDWY